MISELIYSVYILSRVSAEVIHDKNIFIYIIQ